MRRRHSGGSKGAAQRRVEAECRRRGAVTAAQLFVAVVNAAAAKFLTGQHAPCGTPAAARKLLLKDLALVLHPDKNRQLPAQQCAARSAWMVKLDQLRQAL
ncbi:putative uncharacterized protein LOC103952176 [Chlorella sorokiniana]|uniref:Uncharacterized protein n=1 Tax=Chlorella sorokiniana TaxID=3076 RepID=A0A2P6U1W5_CHLSO|nr:putative uncharacterized protein LOC103952176 [Chlorella sorokiniana]|eukprot:PRW60290.1 putative uncharacterized protein LOC103952176 [Chlorella sorokiniana]